LTPGIHLLVFMWPNIRSDTTNTHNNGLIDLLKKRSIYFVNFVIIEMREKLRSQRETVLSLTHPETVRLDSYFLHNVSHVGYINPQYP